MPNTFIAFGLTGDLMRNKGIPAIYSLFQKGVLPTDFRVIGLSRKEWSKDATEEYITKTIGANDADFASKFVILQGEADEPESYIELMKAAARGKKLLYLCVSPELYAPIVGNLSDAGFFEDTENLPLLLIEKPFGGDLGSADDLEELLSAHLPDEHIYRIDHYLAKTGAEEIAAASIAQDAIARIEAYLCETVGAEKRGAVYDMLGTLRDVGQNHLLELVALASGYPSRLEALEALHILSPKEIPEKSWRAQYEGYQQIDGVAENSQTETYFKIETEIELEGGAHIPVLLEAGKSVDTNRKEVVVRLTDGTSRIFSLESHGNEYEKLFAEAMLRNRDRFISREEVEALWHFVDPIEACWKRGDVALSTYAPGTGSASDSI